MTIPCFSAVLFVIYAELLSESSRQVLLDLVSIIFSELDTLADLPDSEDVPSALALHVKSPMVQDGISSPFGMQNIGLSAGGSGLLWAAGSVGLFLSNAPSAVGILGPYVCTLYQYGFTGARSHPKGCFPIMRENDL